MVHVIGEFGAAVDEARGNPEPQTIYLGPDKDEFYVNTDVGFIPFGLYATSSPTSSERNAAVMAFLEEIITANPGTGKNKAEREASARTAGQEWARFQRSAQRQHIHQDVLVSLINAVTSASSGKAQEPPSGSSGGQSKTATSASSSGSASEPGSGSKPQFEPVTGDLVRELGG